MKYVGGLIWMVREFGIRSTVRYERKRRRGVIIDYAEIFSPAELAILGEHFDPAPWER